MNQELPICPSHRIRKLRPNPHYQGMCDRCMEGRGIYLAKDSQVKLICTYYTEVYLPNWEKEQSNKRSEDYVRRQLKGK